MSDILVGLAAAGGLTLMWAWVCARRPTLVNRVTPYAQTRPRSVDSFPTLGAALAQAATRLLGHLGSSQASVATRLRLAGLPGNVRWFRRRQGVAALLGAGGGLALGGVGLLASTLTPVRLIVLVAFGTLGGALWRDWSLTRIAATRQRLLIAQVPDAAELLALAVSAGEAVTDALDRVARLAAAPVGVELARVGTLTRTGVPLARAFGDVAAANDCPGLTRLADATVQALERGTPLAQVLRDQAIDEREAARRDLMERAGKQEIAMLLPVVFLIMPLTVIFALYPGLLALRFDV